MIVIDLTQTITEDMPLFPGTPSPKLHVKHTVERDGFREMEISFYSHTGTHLDTPAHVFDDGKTLKDYSVDQFCGKGLALDISEAAGTEVTLGDFEKVLEKSLSLLNSSRKVPLNNEASPDKILLQQMDYLLFYTGWDKKWGQDDYFTGAPTLSAEVAKRLSEMNLKGIGIDAMTIDPMSGNMLLAHRILLENEVIIIENLKNLEELLGKDFEFFGLPLKIQRGEGSPIRAIAKLT